MNELLLSLFVDPEASKLNNIIKFELTSKMKDLKQKLRLKERQQQERNLINKKAVLNMVLRKDVKKNSYLSAKPNSQ